MKVNVEIDCTPLEARQFIGLPDVAPMQIAVMDKLQQQMMANIDKLSPEALMQSWFTFDPKLAERFQGFRRHHARPRRYAHQQRQEIGMPVDQRVDNARHEVPWLRLAHASAAHLLCASDQFQHKVHAFD